MTWFRSEDKSNKGKQMKRKEKKRRVNLLWDTKGGVEKTGKMCKFIIYHVKKKKEKRKL